MAESYRHFLTFLKKYDEYRKATEYQNSLLMARMRNGVYGLTLQRDLKAYYAHCCTESTKQNMYCINGQWGEVCSEVITCLRQDGINQSHIARWCQISKALVTDWKNGVKKPEKYRWWMIALHTKLDMRQLMVFLSMLGYSYDPFCRQDVILLHGQYMNYSLAEIMHQLQDNGCVLFEKEKK